MAKPQLVHEAGGAHAGSPRPTRTWADNPGTHIAGRAHVDEVDALAIELERKWGCGRLRLLVSAELREKFDRQRYLMNQAIWHGDLEAVRRESGRMVKAWRALDRVAMEAGKQPLPREVWEVRMEDGTVAAIVPDNERAAVVLAEGREMSVFTLDEIGKLLTRYASLIAIKRAWPGATVEAVRTSIVDPLESVGDTIEPLDDPLPF